MPSKKWREANPEKALEQSRKVRQKFLAKPHDERKKQQREAQARYLAKDPERRVAARKRAREWYAANPDKARANVRRAYGVVDPPSQRMVGPCEICSKHADPLCCDHDHATGRFRGWLCDTCNRGLGLLRDNADTLRAAIAYLEKE
jgi:hypothetical protein